MQLTVQFWGWVYVGLDMYVCSAWRAMQIGVQLASQAPGDSSGPVLSTHAVSWAREVKPSLR